MAVKKAPVVLEPKPKAESEPDPPKGVPSPLHARAAGWTVEGNRWIQKGT